MRTLSIWAALVFAVATFGEEPSLTLHVVKVTNREDGYAVEAKSKISITTSAADKELDVFASMREKITWARF